jgi:hypothetical protein
MESLEPVLAIHRIFSKKSQTWIPALKDIADHEVSAPWAAAVLYMIYDRYMSCVPDEHQLEFQRNVFKMFDFMVKNNGADYIYKIDCDE